MTFKAVSSFNFILTNVHKILYTEAETYKEVQRTVQRSWYFIGWLSTNNRFTAVWCRITRVSRCSHKGETYRY